MYNKSHAFPLIFLKKWPGFYFRFDLIFLVHFMSAIICKRLLDNTILPSVKVGVPELKTLEGSELDYHYLPQSYR